MSALPDDWALPELDAVQRGLVHVGRARRAALRVVRARCSTRPRRSATPAAAMSFDARVAGADAARCTATPSSTTRRTRALADAVPYTVVLVSLDDAPHLRVVGNIDGDRA